MRNRLIVSTLLACGACQVYTPMAVTPAASTENVRVSLTDEGSRTLYGTLGYGARQLEGRLGEVTDSTITLSVSQVTRSNGVEETWNGERVTLARLKVAQVERRKTSVGRSALLATAVAGGSFLVGRIGGGGDQVGSARGNGGPVTGH